MKHWPFDIFETPIASLPVAVLDIETTGLDPKHDRIVEIAVVRIDPGKTPKTVLNTIVNPGIKKIPEESTEFHRLKEKHVEGAPTIKSIQGNLVNALAGCILATYGLRFDTGFLKKPLGDAGFDLPPGICLLNFRHVLGIKKACTLKDVCERHGIPLRAAHTALGDARAAAALWIHYRNELEKRDVRTFAKILTLGGHAYVLDGLKGEFITRSARSSGLLKPRNSRGPRRVLS